MYVCVKIVFHNDENKIIGIEFLDIYEYRASTCKEIKIPTNAKSAYICASIIDINAKAHIKVKFFNAENEIINSSLLDICEYRSNCQTVEIPSNSMSVIVCFTTEYDRCENCV